MQHMFSPIPHITSAIEVYLVSDSSYYTTLYLHKGALSSEELTGFFLCLLKQKSWLGTCNEHEDYQPADHFGVIRLINWNHWDSVLCLMALQWWLFKEKIFLTVIQTIYKSLLPR